MMRLLLNIVLFKIGWLACVLGAANGRPWLGPAVVASFMAFHLAFVSRDFRKEASLILVLGGGGAVIDSLNLATGVFRVIAGDMPGPLPVWLAAMWFNFGMLLHHSLSWLRGRCVVGAALGLIGGPFAYFMGARLGAITLAPNPFFSLAVIGVVWAGVMVLILWLAEKPAFDPAANKVLLDSAGG